MIILMWSSVHIYMDLTKYIAVRCIFFDIDIHYVGNWLNWLSLCLIGFKPFGRGFKFDLLASVCVRALNKKK